MERELNVIQKQQQKELEKIELCMEILEHTRQELYLSMRFFDVILSRMDWVSNPDIQGIGTNGFMIYFYPDFVIGMFRKGRIFMNRAYLHMILHCLFLHFQIPEGIEEDLWDLSCDITIESIIDSMNIRSVRRYQSPYRKNIYQNVKKEKNVITAVNVYRTLKEMKIPKEELLKMKMEFYVDDHSLWEKDMSPNRVIERQKQWKEDSEKIQTDMETFSKEQSEGAKTLFEHVKAENKERYDYKKFLRKFSVLKEEMKVDMDTFDYIFYNYGMEMYGNMPLIEPQETKEVYKVEDFVIAIDTSMSCKGDLVKEFLEETYSVLCEKESFFRKINVHIIQCDDKIQSDIVIHSREELKQYMDDFEVKGQGGTDFRPVFAYVNELLIKKAFHRLKGLIYFTDGYGTFPAKRPLYETAFVFMKEDYQDINVPVWAMKLIIEPEDLNRKVEDQWI